MHSCLQKRCQNVQLRLSSDFIMNIDCHVRLRQYSSGDDSGKGQHCERYFQISPHHTIYHTSIDIFGSFHTVIVNVTKKEGQKDGTQCLFGTMESYIGRFRGRLRWLPPPPPSGRKMLQKKVFFTMLGLQHPFFLYRIGE